MLGVDSVAPWCAGLYGEPAVAAVGKGDPGVCGESIDERGGGPTPGEETARGLNPGLRAGFGLSPRPRPYDALRGVPVAGFGLPGNDGAYGLALGSGLPKLAETGVGA